MEEKRAGLWQLFITFFRIGLFTIGGGLAMIPIIRSAMVEKRQWLDDEEMTDIIAVANSLPGIIAINSASMVGYRKRGVPGALFASAGVILPSLIIIFAIAMLFTEKISSNIWVQKILGGVSAGVTALILSAAIKMGKSAIKDLFGLLIALASLLAIVFLKADIALIVLIAAALGFLYYRHRSYRKKGGEAE